MKILHLVQSSNTNIGGSLTVARALVKSQRAMGHDSWLVCLCHAVSVNRDTCEREFEIECNVSRKSRWTYGIVALRRLLRQHSPDIIHHHDGILWPRIAGLFLGYPRITHGHLGAPEVKWHAVSFWVHLLMIQTTDRLIAISPWVAESWKASGMSDDKVVLIPNGIDSCRYYRRKAVDRLRVRKQIGIIDDEYFLLWVGRLDRITKGLERLVAVASKLPNSVRLVIVGDGPDREWLLNSLASSELQCSPLLLGRIDDPADLFGSSDAFLFTSRVEPFGLVLLEAASSGLPVYAFPCSGGGDELLTEMSACVFFDEQVIEMVDAISTRRTGLSDELILRLQERYSWSAISLAIVRIYSECIGLRQ